MDPGKREMKYFLIAGVFMIGCDTTCEKWSEQPSIEHVRSCNKRRLANRPFMSDLWFTQCMFDHGYSKVEVPCK
jgi:hypothetical protein